LSSDIAGGAAFGIDTCWFNRDGKAAGPSAGLVLSIGAAFLTGGIRAPTYEVRGFDELRALL
jgi:FMN phosphatase YigB (HAD superfamily)